MSARRNTPGLRELQKPQKLSHLLRAIGNEAGPAPKPVIVKISPDLSAEELEAILMVCEENGVAGIIAANTTLDHSSIPREFDQEGGLSGTPLLERSTALVREIASRSTIPVIASGGICDVDSAREKISGWSTTASALHRACLPRTATFTGNHGDDVAYASTQRGGYSSWLATGAVALQFIDF